MKIHGQIHLRLNSNVAEPRPEIIVVGDVAVDSRAENVRIVGEAETPPPPRPPGSPPPVRPQPSLVPRPKLRPQIEIGYVVYSRPEDVLTEDGRAAIAEAVRGDLGDTFRVDFLKATAIGGEVLGALENELQGTGVSRIVVLVRDRG
jgi:hypothetical protein